MISVGLDVGGTNTKIAVLNDKYKILKNIKIPTPLSNGYDFFIKELAKIAISISREYQKKKISVCIGIAGDVDSDRGILRYAPNLCEWKNKNIKKDFERVSGFKCLVENDANMASWGIYVFEVKRKVKNMAVFTLGTGVGGGIITNGNLYRGSTSTAGEIGHMIIKEGGEKCNCGNYGCLEAYCGTYALIREVQRRIKNTDSYLKKYGFEKGNITPKIIFDLAEKGDRICLDIWKDYGYRLGSGIGNIAVLLNPEITVLAGGVSRAHKFFMPFVKKRLSEYGIKTPINKMKILISNNEDIGVLGCASFALDNK